MWKSINVSVKPTPIISNSGSWFAIGVAIFLLLLLVLSTFYFSYLIFKNTINLRDTLIYIIWNTFIFIISVYLLVLGIYQLAHPLTVNYLAKIAAFIGLVNFKGKGDWKTLIILIIIVFLYIRSIRNTIKIATLNKNLISVSQRLAVLKNKVHTKYVAKSNNDETRSSKKDSKIDPRN